MSIIIRRQRIHLLKSLETYPIRLGAGKEYWWGINTKHSSSPRFGDSFKYESVVFDLEEAKKDQWNTFGFSPYQWMHTDILLFIRHQQLLFKIKSNELPKLQTILFAYKGEKEDYK